ncbi:MAG: acyl-CoA thioesterase [Acidobacteriota bacterium]
MRPTETSITTVLSLASDAALRRRFMVSAQPMRGNLRFGLTLELLDKMAEETALEYVRRFDPNARVVTAAIDNIRVRRPADVMRDLRFLARVNYVGRTSMEVGIRVEQDGDVAGHIASCYFTMVARSGERSIAIPPLEPADALERRRHERAIARRRRARADEEKLQQPPTREEFEMLHRLHMEQEADQFDGLRVSELGTSSWDRVYPEQENVPHKIFGGYLVHRAYEVAAMLAEELTTHRAVVAAVNRINFKQPVRIGDKLRFASRIVFTGRTSIGVETKIERIARGEQAVRDLTNDCTFTFVHVDQELRPQRVPRVFPATYDEDARYLAAFRRNRTDAELKRGVAVETV